MNRKYCPRCKQYSYSSCSSGNWSCPTCDSDLTKEPILNLNTKSPLDENKKTVKSE